MNIGLVKEIKDKEGRVALTPPGAAQLVAGGHRVRVETGAGLGSGLVDADYLRAGAELVTTAQAWDCDLVVKVKEPLESEYRYLRDQLLFTYLHLAGVAPSLTETLLERETTAIAYETVEDQRSRLPLLAPMSGVAGNMAVVMGAFYLAAPNGGKGMLLGRVMGQGYGRVVVIGDGVVGRHGAQTAVGLGADVVVIGRHPEREPALQRDIAPTIRYVESRHDLIAEQLDNADLVVAAALIRGGRAPRLVTEPMVAAMQAGSVIVDVSIDQGGCVETSRPTSHSDPVFERHGVLHYCVTNMPGAYPRTSTLALTGATLPYLQRLADDGIRALRADPAFAKGVNTFAGFITCEAVADALDLVARYRAFDDIA